MIPDPFLALLLLTCSLLPLPGETPSETFPYMETGGRVLPGPDLPPGYSLGQEAVLDSVRADMAQGRNWHAAQRLEAAFPQGPRADRELLLLFARAEAGWGNWPEVRSLLEAPLTAGQLGAPEGWYLLGRALEAGEEWEGAASAYGQYPEEGSSERDPRVLEVRARRARLLGILEDFSGALTQVEVVAGEDSVLAAWVALDLAERVAERGFRQETRVALSRVGPEAIRRLGWGYPALALLASGDSTGAEAAYWSALPSLSSASDRAEAWDRVARLRLARGDSVGARGAYHQILALGSSGSETLEAAQALLALGFDSVGVALRGAGVLAGAGRHREALEAFDVYEQLLGDSTPSRQRLARARSHLRLGQGGRTLALVTDLAGMEDPDVAAPALALRIQALRQLGRGGETRAVQDELVSRFPQRPEAVEVLFERAEALEGWGDWEGAIQGYRATVEAAPAQNLAGQARMRMGQLLLGIGRDQEALDVYSAYLGEFPEGRRWDEAAYWAGSILLSLARPSEGREVLQRLLRAYPLSYYSVQAGELLGESFDLPIQALSDSLPYPAFLRAGLARIDRLRASALGRGAVWEANNLAAHLRTDQDRERRQRSLLRLAKELNARGYTREGINLGWEVRRAGRPWDRNLLTAVYPFPYREVVFAEAEERGVDPFLLAGLIRQESAFWVTARSRADARGLMQVLPSTGRQLARTQGPSAFRAEEHLFEAEINIHLGTAFFVDMHRRFGEDLPIILSAYNAGPTRAARWRRYPEAGDWPRFVERIPLVETQGYVKNVTANRAIYAWLYGANGTNASRSVTAPPPFLDGPFTGPPSSSLF